MKKIAFVIARYGTGINGGAEVHCRMLAERLLPSYDVEVLTSTIRIFGDSAKDYPEGTTCENGVVVRRFKPQPIEANHNRQYRKQCKLARRIRFYLQRLGILRVVSSLHPVWKWGVAKESRFLKSQVSYTPALLHHIKTHKAGYNALIFINLYFAETVLGSVIAPEKSILIPLAHPNKPLYYSINAPAFTRVKHIAFNTAAEERLCRSIFGKALAPASIVGCGIEEAPAADWDRVKVKYGLPEHYVLYLGRVSEAKVDKLLPYFLRYKKHFDNDVKLVLAGGFEASIKRFEAPDIHFTGYVSDEEKSAIIRHSAAMVNPSPMESLSLLMLEGMQNRIPLLVNGRSEVMKDHCRLSGAALWYDNGRDFGRKLHRLLSDSALRRAMSEKGPAYIHEHYDWDVIISKLRKLIENI
ncbi:glycosyltransferase family 4 protein [Alistipes sp. D31t1_170403_E11]|uniref:glycosyltransferase family 4 protein n=1 Tax=Alistipes sp. D31t1_170403_E11 TaxID=2787128 RepID=UPI001898E627|nr:glycosyltransferase family 4 protein [Alistipes sp. D31t1_170403_E11]